MSSPWPLRVDPLTPASCGSAVWRMGGALGVTVFVKARFGLVHDGAARLIAPAKIVRDERHRDNDPSSSVEEASEAAPYLPSAGILLTGAAHAPPPRPVPAMSVRLAVFRDRPVLDKTLHVFGDRVALSTASPAPFQTMPIVYERAYGGADVDANPVGVGTAAGLTALPNIVDPKDPWRPAGFGPVSKYWPVRKHLLGTTDRKKLGQAIAVVPQGFDWRYFHAAPPDQQVDFLNGDEWIVLDGMHPSLPRVQTRLPSARGQAHYHQASPAGVQDRAIDLRADMLVIDAEHLVCSVIWRGHFMIEHESALQEVRVFAGVELPGLQIAWPAPVDIPIPVEGGDGERRFPNIDSERRDQAPPASEPPSSLGSTRTLDPNEGDAAASRPASPFQAPPPASRPESARGSAFSVVDDSSESTRLLDLSAMAAQAQQPVVPFTPAPASALEMASSIDDTLTRPALQLPGDLPFKPRPPASIIDTATHVKLEVPESTLPFAPKPPASIVDTLTQPALRIPEKSLPFAPGAPVAAPSAAGQGSAFAVPSAIAARKAEDSSTDELELGGEETARLDGTPDALGAVLPFWRAERAAPPPPPSERAAPPPSQSSKSAELTIEAPEAAPRSSEPAALPREEPPSPAPASGARGPDAAPQSAVRDMVIARLLAGEAFYGVDLSRADLRDLDFSGRSMAGCNLQGATLQRCLFTNARLAEAQLGGADLTEAAFTGADLSRADLTRATVARARFDGATVAEIKLTAAQGPGASFVGATGRRASFARGVWDGAAFGGADLLMADFTGASLEGATFEGASLAEVNLGDARGSAAVFDGARMPRARAQGATLQRCSLKGVDAQGSLWEKATLSGSTFEGANLKGAVFLRATCDQAGFARAEMGGANLQHLHADAADLRGVNLEGADLRQARLHDACFDDAIMRRVTGHKADLARCRLARADLKGAALRSAKLKGANLSRALLDGADLRDADLEQANVHGASRVGAKMSGANTKDLVETDPEPEQH